MTLEPMWNNAVHDAVLKLLHSQQFSDYVIADWMSLSTGSVRHHLRRLGLQSNKMQREPSRHEQAAPPPQERPNPLAVAHTWLGRRLVEKPSGYWMDGRPVSLDTIMKTTNRILKLNRREQIGPQKWRTV